MHKSPLDQGYRYSNETPEWSYIVGKTYWSMTGNEDSSLVFFGVNNTLQSAIVFDNYYIRPVINLKKSAIENGCHLEVNSNEESELTYDYFIGDAINYNNTSYCVINDSKRTDDYVTLLKREPLTNDELTTYNNEYEIYGSSISYYRGENCLSSDNKSGCKYSCDISFVKDVIDNWSNSFNEDLKEINGYKTRLLYVDELTSLGFRRNYIGTSADNLYIYEGSNDSCFYSDYSYWMMWASKVGRSYESSAYLYEQYAVRPVINLKKCAIDGTC